MELPSSEQSLDTPLDRLKDCHILRNCSRTRKLPKRLEFFPVIFLWLNRSVFPCLRKNLEFGKLSKSSSELIASEEGCNQGYTQRKLSKK